ncbi:MAG: DNA polymerase/3'-5' exonuclease PolX [Candidatus Goldiibacteriota bacterium]
MKVMNSEIADIFNRTADYLEIKGENRFRIRAYREAARIINNMSRQASDRIKEGEDLSQMEGIGRDLAGKIEQIVKSGRLDILESLEKEMPKGLGRIMDISGMGGRKIKKLYDELHIKSITDLKKAAKKGKIRDIEGFGKKTEKNILEEIARVEKTQGRYLLDEAAESARNIIDYLEKSGDIKKIEAAGSCRRMKETVGDLDILITCGNPEKAIEKFLGYENIKKTAAKGEKKSSVILRNGMQVDLRAFDEENYGAAMMYFTGSKEHNVSLRKTAIEKKMKLNEYGLFKGGKKISGKTEKDMYEKLGLQYIDPVLRENRGEIEAASKNRLPVIVREKDIKGDLHMHSKYTDGRNTIMEMAQRAKKRGYSYIGISDHSRKVKVAGGMGPDEFVKQMKEIDRINKKIKGLKILKGIEVDILEDGSLDMPDEALKKADYTICAVHSKFSLSKKKQTERIIKAMDNGFFRILAHPSGRMLNSRAPYEADFDRIFDYAAEKRKIMEVNSHPHRLDLCDADIREVIKKGGKLCISTDSHSVDGLENIKFGIGTAGRGWAEKKDIINTKTLKDLKKILEI